MASTRRVGVCPKETVEEPANNTKSFCNLFITPHYCQPYINYYVRAQVHVLHENTYALLQFYSKNFSKSNISLNIPIMLIPALCKDVCVNFSGFSVGFCINEEKVISYQLELRMFRLNAPFTLTTTITCRHFDRILLSQDYSVEMSASYFPSSSW